MTKQLLCGRRIAALFLGKNERTVQRWCNDGVLAIAGFDARNRVMISIADVLAIFGERKFVDHELAELISEADKNSAEAQNDLGITLLQEERPSGAFALFKAAAEQDYPDAMHWLYHCYQNGIGIERDEIQAMMWLNNAAAHGHKIARLQANAITRKKML
jgi:hypothetical protein